MSSGLSESTSPSCLPIDAGCSLSLNCWPAPACDLVIQFVGPYHMLGWVPMSKQTGLETIYALNTGREQQCWSACRDGNVPGSNSSRSTEGCSISSREETDSNS